MGETFVFNPLSKAGFDQMPVSIPDGIPSPWDASGGNLPPVTPGVADWFIITADGVLPGIGPVTQGGYLIYDGSTWTYINNSASSGGGVISDTYNNILALKNAGNLVPGALYEITDYRMSYLLPGSQDYVMNHQVSPIIIQAVSNNHFGHYAFDLSRPHIKLGYNFNDNEIILNSVYLSGLIQNLPQTTGLRVVGYGTNRIDFDRKPIGIGGGTGGYIYITSGTLWGWYNMSDVGTNFTITQVGSNWRVTFLDKPYNFVTDGGNITAYVGVLLQSRTGWINYFYDTRKNITARFDIQNAMVRRYWATERLNGQNTGNAGFWRPIHRTFNVYTSYNHYQLVSSLTSYVDRRVLMNYNNVQDVVFDFDIKNNMCFENIVNGCYIGPLCLDTHIMQNISNVNVQGRFDNNILYEFKNSYIDATSNLSSISKPTHRFENIFLYQNSSYSSNIVSTMSGYDIEGERLYNSRISATTFGIETLKNTYNRTNWFDNNLTGTGGGARVVDNVFDGGSYQQNNFNSIVSFFGNRIYIASGGGFVYSFRNNTGFSNVVGCEINVYGNIQNNNITNLIDIKAKIFGNNAITSNTSSSREHLVLNGLVNNNTVYSIKDVKCNGNFVGNIGMISTVQINNCVFNDDCNNNTFNNNGQLNNCKFYEKIFNNTFNYIHDGIISRQIIDGVIDTQNTTPATIDLMSNSPRKYFTLSTDEDGNLLTNEFIF